MTRTRTTSARGRRGAGSRGARALSAALLLLRPRGGAAWAPPAPPAPRRVPAPRAPWTPALAAAPGDDATTTTTTDAAAPSKRARRKAAERAKKQRRSDPRQRRQQQRQQQQQQRQREQRPPSRRKHDFAARDRFLTAAERADDAFDARLDAGPRGNQLTNTGLHPAEDPHAVHPGAAHPLHSTGVARLDLAAGTRADDVVRAIKRAQNLHDVHDVREIAHFLLEEVDVSFAYGYRGSLLSRLAVASLHLHNYDIAERCITERRITHRASMLPLESAALVRGLLRCHRVQEAWEVLEDELRLPLEGWVDLAGSDDDGADADGDGEVHLEEAATRRRLEARDVLVHRARSIASIASRHLYEGEPAAGLAALARLTETGDVARAAGLTAKELGLPWERLVRGAALCEKRRREAQKERKDAAGGGDGGAGDGGAEGPEDGEDAHLPYAVLDAMAACPPENGDAAFAALGDALVRRTEFVTGAVDLAGCPEADRGEAAFVGRSNVGKSSLVNMLTNRRALAFTSKTPGKTQQFNYFAVNDKPELARQVRYGDAVPGSKDRDAFYLVDLPGFGFAKVPQQQRQQWSDFMDAYLLKRSTLRVIFHLIDARHGPTDEDRRIMRKVGALEGSPGRRNHAKYVLVLTKADKNVKGAAAGKNPGKVTAAVREQLAAAARASGVGFAPVVLTSAETRLGRDEMWKFLRLAAGA